MFIYPTKSLYSQRNFDFRISSATVDNEISEFTRLSGYHRILIILDKAIKLQHNDGKYFTLNPMKIHEFDGGQKTVSVGNCTDFNVMVSDKYTVKTEIVFFDKNESKMLDLKVNHEFEFYYCVHGSCNLYAGNQLYKIKSNDLLQIKKSG